jgi:hypothetical protein
VSPAPDLRRFMAAAGQPDMQPGADLARRGHSPGRYRASKRIAIDLAESTLYRFRTHRKCCDLRFGRMGWLRQDLGSCLFDCST